LDDLRLIDAEGTELDAAERRAAPVEKAASVVKNTAAGGWPEREE